MRGVALLAALACASALAGCSRERGVRCDDSSRYAVSTTIPPIRVPDDLSIPDESQALVIPSPPPQPGEVPPDRCLESPPDFAAPVPSR